MSHTCDCKHFTVSEVAADWHELMILTGWWHGIAVTRFIQWTKLLYAGPG